MEWRDFKFQEDGFEALQRISKSVEKIVEAHITDRRRNIRLPIDIVAGNPIEQLKRQWEELLC